MFTRHLAAICALAALGTATTAQADDTKAGHSYGSARDLFYASLGVERIDHDFNNVGAPINLGFSTGVRIPTIDWIGAELAGSVTVIPGKNDNQSGSVIGQKICIGGVGDTCPPPPGGGGGGGTTPQERDDLQLFNIGIYAVLRSPGRFYATGRVGYRYLQSNFDELYDERSGVGWGAGLGWRWGDTLSGVEALYNGYGGGLDSISLGVVYGFGG